MPGLHSAGLTHKTHETPKLSFRVEFALENDCHLNLLQHTSVSSFLKLSCFCVDLSLDFFLFCLLFSVNRCAEPKIHQDWARQEAFTGEHSK